MPEEKRNDELPQPPQEETDAAFSGPAPFSNKIYVSLAGPLARLAFLELTPGDLKPVFRTAVTITIADLIALQGVIENMRKHAKFVEIKPEHENG